MIRIFASILLIVASASASAADSHGREEDPRWNFNGWTPYMDAMLGVHVVGITGSVDTREDSGNGASIRTPKDTDGFAVSGLLRLSLGIETPEIPVVPGHIRFFGNVDYYVTFPPDRKAVGEGDPDGFSLKPGFFDPPVEAIEGQGSELKIRTNRSAYGATAGISVPIEIAGFRFFLKSGASWMRYEWDMKGLVLAAIKNPNVFGRDYRAVELRARGKLYSTGVGPYVGLEVAPTVLGPLAVGAFIDAAYYRTIGDRDANFTASQTLSGDNLPTDTYLARWGVRVDKDFWRASAGIRVYLAAD
jgi:hypothetical protein